MKKIKIGYILSRFPSVYQPWVALEISSTKKEGFDVQIFSLKKPNKKIKHETAKDLMEHVYYAPYFLSIHIISHLLKILIKEPSKIYSIIKLIFNGYKNDKKNMFKALIILPKILHYSIIMKREQVNHIHAHWATFPALVALIISRLENISYSITCHAIDIFDETTMLEEKINNAQFIITCTKYNKMYLENMYCKNNEKKVFLNYHGKDLSILKRGQYTNTEKINILSVGRLSHSKGYEYLIEGINKIKEKDRIKCIIIGDGPRKKPLIKLIKKYHLEKIIIIKGALPYEEVLKYYNMSKIFVLSMVGNPEIGYPHRGIPNVISEAMAMGIPVITTSLPAIDELVENELHGFIVPEKDSQAIAISIEKLINNKRLIKLMGQKGRRKVEKMYDINKNIRELVKIFETQVKNK